MKTYAPFFAGLLSASLVLAFALLVAEGNEPVKYYKPVEEYYVYKGTDGFAANNLSDKTIIFDYSRSSLMRLQAVVKNVSPKEDFQLQFKGNATEMPDPSNKEKKIRLMYSKLRPNVALIAQEKEASDASTEQYVLMFTSPTAGVAQCTWVTPNGLEEVVVNIRFRVE